MFPYRGGCSIGGGSGGGESEDVTIVDILAEVRRCSYR